MFYFLWAVKNLVNNRRKTIRNILFIMAASSILFLLFSFQRGSVLQHEASLRGNIGDILIGARSGDYTIEEVGDFLGERFGDKIDTIINEYRLDNCHFINNSLYDQDSLIGINPEYFEMNKDYIYWKEGRIFNPGTFEVVLESKYAKNINVKTGDSIFVQYQTDFGVINTIQVIVTGIFVANEFIYHADFYTSLETAYALALKDNKINRMRLYLNNPDDELIYEITDTLEKRFEDIAYYQVREWHKASFPVSWIFESIWSIIGIIFMFVGIVTLIVFFLAIYNSFYLEKITRNSEISTLLTYGMKHSALHIINFYETIILLISGVMGAGIFTIVFTRILGNIVLIDKLRQLIILFGGPHFKFKFLVKDIIFVFVFILITGSFATFRALKMFLKRDVREIVSY